MIELSVIFGLYVIGSLTVIHHLGKEAREERAELELALMALSKPEAALTHKTLMDPEPAQVKYTGEEPTVVVTENGHVSYEDED